MYRKNAAMMAITSTHTAREVFFIAICTILRQTVYCVNWDDWPDRQSAIYNLESGELCDRDSPRIGSVTIVPPLDPRTTGSLDHGQLKQVAN